MVKHIPLMAGTSSANQFVHQITEPKDVAQQLLWLASSEASFMNGEILEIDGGIGLTGSDYG